MAPRLAPLLAPPVMFAHRGARAHAPENTLVAFELAVKLGATGLESDVWVTADGEAVLDHDGEVGRWPRRRPLGTVPRADLPGHIPTLAELYDHVGTSLELSLDMKDPASFDAVVATARAAGGDAEERLWLCHHRLDVLREWRNRTSARLVDSTRLSRIKEGLERRANELRDLGIDAINLRFPDWSGGQIALVHRYDRLALGWDAQHRRELASLIDSGIDGVYSDHVDRMVDEVSRHYPESTGR